MHPAAQSMRLQSRRRSTSSRYRLAGAITLIVASLCIPTQECLAQVARGSDSARAKALARVVRDWKVDLSALQPPKRELGKIHAQDASDVAGKIGVHLYRLDSVAKEHLVYVPRSCENKTCPLLVYLPWGGETAQRVMTWMQAPAEKYGLIVLATGYYDYATTPEAKRDFDIALRQTLRDFPVNRDRIGIVGNCHSGGASILLGVHNLDIFTRIASVSGGADSVTLTDLPPQSSVNRPIEFFIDNEMPSTAFKQVAAIERRGYRVKHRVGWRTHSPNEMYFDALGQWLVESWTIPNPADRIAPAVVADPLPKLTSDAVVHMTEFWKQFMKQPDMIVDVARKTYRREVVVPVGDHRVLMTMMDVPTLAAKYPTVAAALKAAGLTAQQHEAYRVAIASALLDKEMLKHAADLKEIQAHPPKLPNAYMLGWGIDIIPNFTIDASSVQGANMEFLNTHPDELNALLFTGMTRTP